MKWSLFEGGKLFKPTFYIWDIQNFVFQLAIEYFKKVDAYVANS